MRERLTDVGVVLLAIALLPILCLAALFYDEDPNDGYKFQNW